MDIVTKIRVNSWLFISLYAIQATSDEIAFTTVEGALQISPFLQNKPNLPDDQMNVTVFYAKDYKNKSNCKLCENKPNTKPIKANLLNAQMNVNKVLTKDYENNPPFRATGKQTQTKPISNGVLRAYPNNPEQRNVIMAQTK